MGFSKTNLLAGLLLAPLALGKPCGGGSGCNANDCLRGKYNPNAVKTCDVGDINVENFVALRKIIGTELRGEADCSTYFVTTVIPPTS